MINHKISNHLKRAQGLGLAAFQPLISLELHIVTQERRLNPTSLAARAAKDKLNKPDDPISILKSSKHLDSGSHRCRTADPQRD